MKKILNFVPFVIFLWLAISSPMLIGCRGVVDTYYFVNCLLSLLLHSQSGALFIMLIIVPFSSLFCCLRLVYSEKKNKILSNIYSFMTFISLLAIPFCFAPFLMSL